MRRTDAPPGLAKECTRCHQVKALDLFYVARHRKDGKTSECAECLRAKNNAQYEAKRQQDHLDQRSRMDRLEATLERIERKLDLLLNGKRAKPQQREPIVYPFNRGE